jgi:hypothetical protein
MASKPRAWPRLRLARKAWGWGEGQGQTASPPSSHQSGIIDLFGFEFGITIYLGMD